MPMSVKELLRACEEEIKKGNGDKVVLLSDDDEGNGFHVLHYSFLNGTSVDEMLEGSSHCHCEGYDGKNAVILG